MKSALKSRPLPAGNRRNAGGREARLEFRLTVEARERIEKAAIVNGQTLSDFASSVLLHEANEVLHSHNERVLSESEWEKFAALLSRSPKPNRALKSAAARYKKGRVAGEEFKFSIGKK